MRVSKNKVALALVLSAGLASPSAAMAGSGRVTCVNQDPVVGVWVNVSGGVSGWASRGGSGYNQSWQYNTQGRTYSLTVGCGGTPQRWRASTSTPNYAYWSSVTCFPGARYGFGGVYARDRCYNG